MKGRKCIITFCLILLLSACAAADQAGDNHTPHQNALKFSREMKGSLNIKRSVQGFTLLDIVKKPIEMILAPVRGGGFLELVTKPAEVITTSLVSPWEIVITPSRTPEYVFNVNKNITGIDEEEIKRTNPKNVQEIISRASGVTLNGYLANAKDNNIDIRGFGESGSLNYLVLVDGRRTNQIDISGADLAQVDIDSIERIEIARGANSVLYGDNATGGVVNIITKKRKEGHNIEYTQETGSYQYRKEYISASGANGFMDYFLSYSYQDSNGYRLNNGYQANDIFSSFNMKPADSAEIHISSGYHRDWYGLSGAVYPGNIQNDGREGSRFPNDKAKTEDGFLTCAPSIFAEYEGNEVVFSVPVSYRARRANSVSKSFNIYEVNHHIVSTDLSPKLEINSAFLDDNVNNKFILGADYFYAKDQILSGDITLTKQQYDITKETLGLYASDNILIGKRVLINGGVRGEWAEYIFDQNTPAESYNTSSLREISAECGLGYKYNEKSQIYANYARSYRYPATDEFFSSAYEYMNWLGTIQVVAASINTALKQQIGNNYEIGIKDNSFGIMNVSAAYYLIDNKNEIYYDPILYQNGNYHHTVHHGLEMETRFDIFEKIKAFFAYTFQKAFFVGGKFAGKTIPLVPENKISAGLDICPVKGMNIDFILNYIGARFITSDQVNEVPKLKEHMTCDVAISCDITENLKIYGSIKNILGEEYFMNATKDWQGNAALYPAPKQNFEVGVILKF